jgi:hypothetical protein
MPGRANWRKLMQACANGCIFAPTRALSHPLLLVLTVIGACGEREERFLAKQFIYDGLLTGGAWASAPAGEGVQQGIVEENHAGLDGGAFTWRLPELEDFGGCTIDVVDRIPREEDLGELLLHAEPVPKGAGPDDPPQLARGHIHYAPEVVGGAGGLQRVD